MPGVCSAFPSAVCARCSASIVRHNAKDHAAIAPRLRDELLNGEIFCSLREAQIVIEGWRRHYNQERPHLSLGYKPPAYEMVVPSRPAVPSPLVGVAPTAPLFAAAEVIRRSNRGATNASRSAWFIQRVVAIV